MFAYLWIMFENWFGKTMFDLGITNEWCRHYLWLGSDEAVASFVGFEAYWLVAIACMIALVYGFIKTKDIHVWQEVKSMMKA